jgi:polyphosphate kinase
MMEKPTLNQLILKQNHLLDQTASLKLVTVISPLLVTVTHPLLTLTKQLLALILRLQLAQSQHQMTMLIPNGFLKNDLKLTTPLRCHSHFSA